MGVLLAANWKMNLGVKSSVVLCSELKSRYPSLKNCEIWLTPSYPAISPVASEASGSKIQTGAQNAHWADSGAFTGEVSCSVLKECGASFAIVGHSERRHIFNETNETVIKRAEAVRNSGLNLIFCIGETLAQRESGATEAIISDQLSLLPAIQGNANNSADNEIIIAYEPVWAIGTGKVASLAEIQAAHSFIKKFWEVQGKSTCPRILYGGSVNSENIAAISKLENVAGALIGGASNTLASFSAIIDAVEKS